MGPHRQHSNTQMAPSLDQQSSTPTSIDLDLHQTPNHQSSLSLPATPTMHTHSTIPPPPPPDQAQEIAILKRIRRSNDEIVSYVRIPVHPWVAMAWNEVTQTLSLPMRLEPPPQPNSYHMPRTHVRVRCSVQPYQAPIRHSRAPIVKQRNI